VDFGLYLETGASRGGQEIAEMRKPEDEQCNEWEQFWSDMLTHGCSDYYDVSAGDGSETSLGGVVQFNTNPMVIMRVSKTLGGGPISEAGHHYRGLVVRRPHTDVSLSLGLGTSRRRGDMMTIGAGATRFNNTTIDLTNFEGTSDLGGNVIEFKDATGWFLEVTGQSRYFGFGFRRVYVDHTVDSIDGASVVRGETIRGDYSMLFIRLILI
jgi:hypothetical protein